MSNAAASKTGQVVQPVKTIILRIAFDAPGNLKLLGKLLAWCPVKFNEAKHLKHASFEKPSFSGDLSRLGSLCTRHCRRAMATCLHCRVKRLAKSARERERAEQVESQHPSHYSEMGDVWSCYVWYFIV